MRIANYMNLTPGDYVFRVIASNSDGVWNYEGASVDITILAPFWRTWWFIVIMTVLAAAIIGYIVTARVKNLFEIEKLKTKIAADLHDSIGAGLTEISILSELASKELDTDNGKTSLKLNNISEMARSLVDRMSDIVWVVNPKRDTLQDLIRRLKDSYADLLSYVGISFRTKNLEMVENLKLPMEYKQNLYLIFKEGINNALKHSKCRKITLEAVLKGDTLVITLEDDGIGIEEQDVKRGNGLRNIKSRAEAIGGRLTWKSAPEKGTMIRFAGKIARKNVYGNLFRQKWGA